MTHNIHHEHLVKEFSEMLKPLLDNSPQAIMLYLDDEHKTCNKKYAQMLGYKSVKAWEKNEFPLDDLDEKDHKKVIKAYMGASRNFEIGSANGTMKKKGGGRLPVKVSMVPLPYKKEVFVLEFFSKD